MIDYSIHNILIIVQNWHVIIRLLTNMIKMMSLTYMRVRKIIASIKYNDNTVTSVLCRLSVLPPAMFLSTSPLSQLIVGFCREGLSEEHSFWNWGTFMCWWDGFASNTSIKGSTNLFFEQCAITQFPIAFLVNNAIFFICQRVKSTKLSALCSQQIVV